MGLSQENNPGMNILITGASSGLGAALARAYAAPGGCLGLLGRNRERLAAVAEACRVRGAVCETAALDVTDREGMAAWLQDFDTRHPVDLVMANAGISGGTDGMAGETEAQARRIFATNVDGVFNTLHPLLPRMKERRRGQVAIMSSLAGLRGLPTAPAYSASKGAVRLYGEGLRQDLAPFGVHVSVICPGFITTPMTAVNTFPMPFLMSAEQAARRIRHGLNAHRARIAFPQRLYMPLLLLSALPVAWGDFLLKRLPAKPARSTES